MRINRTSRRAAAVSLVSATLLTTLAFTATPASATPSASPRSGSDSTPTGAEAQSERPQKRFTPEYTKGKKAVEVLGSKLDEVAAKSDLSTAALKKALLEDDTLQVSDSGTLQVADALGGTGSYVATGSSNTLLWPVGNTNYLHSRPSSPRKIYLDFNGHTTTGTVWNSQYSSFTTPVWGRDGDASTFNAVEAAAIQQAYASVAEDFAAFDVDVTTQDPGVEGLRRTSSTDAYYGTRVVVGPNTWLNVGNSGYAQIGSFTWNSDTPAYCFANATTATKQIAECISHEAGHTVGLYHDGASGGVEYYGGHGNWAPIMGNSYGRSVTQWSKGQYAGANQFQDDIYVIGNYLGWVPDDYAGNTSTSATLPAGTTRTGRITYGSGEQDAFRFSLSGTRRVNIQSWEWFQAVDTNLNMRVQVTNSAGTVLYTSSPAGNTRTNMTVTLGAGQYFVFVTGVGEGTASTGYTNYASLGYYNLLLQFV
jgi:hypothetical protein